MFVERTIQKVKNVDEVGAPSSSFCVETCLKPVSPWHPPCLCLSHCAWPPELRIKRQNSSDSISSLNSITSHSSIGSGKDADAKKKKKKSWVGKAVGGAVWTAVERATSA